MEKKTYITLKNIPGGIKAGTYIKRHSNDVYIFDNGMRCIFDPSTDSEFFREVYETKYKVGDKVYLSKKFLQGPGRRGISPKTSAVIYSAQNASIKTNNYVIIIDGKKHSVTDNDIYIPDVYFFISSRGTIQSEVLSDEHKKTLAYTYRMYSGNYFETKDLAQFRLNDILSKK